MSSDKSIVSNLTYYRHSENPDLLKGSILCGQIQAFKYIYNTYLMLKEGSAKDRYYLTHCATASGNLKLLKWIIQNTKCNIDDQDPDGLTILHVASLTANLEVVEWLLQSTHLSPITRTSEGATPLHFAAWSGDFEVTKHILKTEPRLLNMRMFNGATAAMFATQGGFVEIMELLFNEGANFGLPIETGVNCLHLAAQQGQLDALKWLIANTGLNINCKDENGATPLNYAEINNRHDVVAWLNENTAVLPKDHLTEESSTADTGDHTSENLSKDKEVTEIMPEIKVTGFSTLEIVQKRLKNAFYSCEGNSLSSDKSEQLVKTDKCVISIDVLLLLQSALSDLHNQYECLLKQCYKSGGADLNITVSRDTQTVESSLDLTLPYELQQSSAGIDPACICHSVEITSTESQTSDTDNIDSVPPAPPPPPTGPPPTIPDCVSFRTIPLLLKLKERRKQRRTSSTRRRVSTSHNDIRKSLIQELKEKNTLRSKLNRRSDCETTFSDSITLIDNMSTLDESSNSSENQIRNTITDSIPNIVTLFNNTENSSIEEPNLKLDLNKKPILFIKKETENVKTVDKLPQWKREIIEKRVSSPEQRNGNFFTNNVYNISDLISSSPSNNKVTELVNKWQGSGN